MNSGDILTGVAVAGVLLSAIYCASLLISWRSGAAAELKASLILRALYRTPIYHTKKFLATGAIAIRGSGEHRRRFDDPAAPLDTKSSQKP